MPNKRFDQLNELDQILRRTTPIGMRDEVDVTIRKITGFELFNTRPYHNYENWSDGYEIEGQGIKLRREDLDEAIKEWAKKVQESKADAQIGGV